MATYIRPIPAKATPPGSFLKDELEFRNIEQKDFAAAIGMNASDFNEVIKGKRPINKELANKIGERLGTPANIWINLQHHYEQDLMRISERDSKERQPSLFKIEWGSLLDIKQLNKKLQFTSE